MQKERRVISVATRNVLFSVEKDLKPAVELLRRAAVDTPDAAAKTLVARLAGKLETVHTHIAQAAMLKVVEQDSDACKKLP